MRRDRRRAPRGIPPTPTRRRLCPPAGTAGTARAATRDTALGTHSAPAVTSRSTTSGCCTFRRSSWTMRSARPGATVQNTPATRPTASGDTRRYDRGAAGQRQRAEHVHRALGARLGPLEQQPADRDRPRRQSRSARAPGSTLHASDVGRAATANATVAITIGRTSSRSATRVATPATGSESGSADVADDADAHRPSASANAAIGAPIGTPVAVTKYIVAPVTATIVTALSRLAATNSRRAVSISRPSADADQHTEHGERDRHGDVEPRQHARREQAETAGTEERTERQEDRGRRQRRREPERGSRPQQRQQPGQRRRQGRRGRHAQAAIERVRSAELAPADVPRPPESWTAAFAAARQREHRRVDRGGRNQQPDAVWSARSPGR